MGVLRRYIFSICGGAIIVSVIQGILPKDGVLTSQVKLICRLFLTVTVLSPLVHWQEFDLVFFDKSWSYQADQLVEDGTQMAAEQKAAIIKQQTQTYILDKAASMGLSITADVKLHEETSLPDSVVITGNLSPYEKSVLTQYIQQNLAIPKEKQLWN